MNVISYSLFTNHPQYGHRSFYWEALPGVVRAHNNFFPDYELRLHHDSSINLPCGKVLAEYEREGLLKLVYVEENIATCRSMLWRMIPAWDHRVDYVFCRDIDSLPSIKDRRCIDDFVTSGKSIHAVGDNQSHSGMMGGMVGFSPAFRHHCGFPNWTSFVESYADQEFPMHVPSGGPDQILMNRMLPPRFEDDMLVVNYRGQPYQGVAPVPDFISFKLAEESERLTPFLGAPGFDVPEAVRIFGLYGNPDVAHRASEAELRAQL